MKPNLSLLAILVLFSSCAKSQSNQQATSIVEPNSMIVAEETIPFPSAISETPTPKGYIRAGAPANSWAEYLRQLPLKPEGTPVYCYDSSKSYWTNSAYGVIDMEIGNQDLQQCADAIIRLRAEWLYQQNKYSDIHFNFTNGFNCEYLRYAKGERVQVQGNKTTWYQSAGEDYSYKTFRKYLDLVFMYAGTASLSRELHTADMHDIQIGDIFMQGGHPGHAMLVIDMAQDSITGDKAILVAQSYMPAQDIHIIAAMNKQPWFFVKDFLETGYINLRSWSFELNNLMRF